MSVRFDDLDTGWRFSVERPPDVIIEVEWCFARGAWLKGVVVGGSVTHDPIPVDLPPPDGLDEDERFEDARTTAEAHLAAVAP